MESSRYEKVLYFRFIILMRLPNLLKALIAQLTLLLWVGSAKAQVPTVQDCLGAIRLCTDTVVVNFNHNGMGNYANEIANVSSCYAPEQRSVWITFTIQQGGILRFEINPTATNQDHDWTLFDMTNTTCAALATTTGASAAMVRSNTWGAFGFNGSTGVSTPNGGIGTCNGPGGTNGPKWCADLTVPVGNTYALHITNWTGSVYGFEVDFSSSTAVLYDSIAPYMDTITSVTSCNSFSTITVKFSEPIKCDSTQAADFAIFGPGGVHTVTSISSTACTAGQDYSDTYTLTFTPAVTQIGNYQLKIIPGAGYVEDACGNLDFSDSLSFEFSGGVDFDMIATNPVCNGFCDGEIQTTITEGLAPFTYHWNGGLPANSGQTNLCATTYSVTVTDNAGCTKSKSILVSQPTPIISTIDTTHWVSCYGTTNCDGGAKVIASGGTPPYYYFWPSSEYTQVATKLCAGSNHVTVTDANGCVDSVEAFILTPDSIVTSGHGDTLICITNVAAIAATSIGGTPPFTYIWTEGSLSGPVVGLNPTLSLTPNVTTSYYVTSTDSKGCEGDTSIVVVNVRPPLGLELPLPDTICPGDTSEVFAFGLGGDSVYTYSWSTGEFGKSVMVAPSVSQWYYVTVGDDCGTPQYADSVFQQVGGYSPIKAEIRVEDDSLCPGESIYMIAKGYGGFGGPDEYRFKWEHVDDENKIQFIQPKQTKKYSVIINDLCLSEPGYDTITVYIGETELPEVSFSPEKACAQNDITMTINKPLPGYSYRWDMGDGWVFEEKNDSVIYYQYTDTGCYDVSMDLISDFGCVASMDFDCAIRVLQQPVASFSSTPSTPTNLQPILKFENQSLGADNWTWTIEHNDIKNVPVISHEFNEFNDYYEVRLVAQSKDGCLDTMVRVLSYEMETTLFYPTSFTPNGDGLNDCFQIMTEGVPFEHFDLTIYDRWGRQVFRSINQHQCWDGTNPFSEIMNSGSYPFVLRYRDHTGVEKMISDKVVISITGDKTELH
ncbi:MAG: gliding motility-associated C-terminal domain-containing protein [Flavobacteriales bacterium]